MSQTNTSYTTPQLSALVLARLAIGWHFLYEGISKFQNPDWSSVGYLLDSRGWFKGLFFEIANSPTLLQVADSCMIWGLIAVGLSLILGLFSRLASIVGLLILSMFYLSHPPLIGVNYAAPSEGSYLFINKVSIEFFALLILTLFPSSKRIGIDRLICSKK